MAFAAFAGDGRILVPPREHDAAARPAPPVQAVAPMVAPITGSVVCRSVTPATKSGHVRGHGSAVHADTRSILLGRGLPVTSSMSHSPGCRPQVAQHQHVVREWNR